MQVSYLTTKIEIEYLELSYSHRIRVEYDSPPRNHYSYFHIYVEMHRKNHVFGYVCFIP